MERINLGGSIKIDTSLNGGKVSQFPLHQTIISRMSDTVFIYKLCWADSKYSKPHTTMYYNSIESVQWAFNRSHDPDVFYVKLVKTYSGSDKHKTAIQNTTKDEYESKRAEIVATIMAIKQSLINP
jgi:hypothetical protein